MKREQVSALWGTRCTVKTAGKGEVLDMLQRKGQGTGLSLGVVAY